MSGMQVNHGDADIPINQSGAQSRMSAKVRLFLSYSRGDDDGLQPDSFVRRLYDQLTARGFNVWWDRAKMPSRALTFLQEVRDAITISERLIFVVGPAAVVSDYVRAEWDYALSICQPVIPILRFGKGNNDNCEDYGQLPVELANLHCPDFRETRRYDEALDELVRVLSEPVAPLGQLISVPHLPPHFLPRPEDIVGLWSKILPDITTPIVITSARQIGQATALHGMAGIGKSVLATAFSRTCETRRAFPDGVLWLNIGTKVDLLAKLTLTGEMFGDSTQHYATIEAAKARLAQVFSGKMCLLALDDLWDVQHAEPFRDVLAGQPHCRLLITTRDRGLVNALGAQEQRVDVLSDDAALLLLADWVGISPASLPIEARLVGQECGNLPFALALCGAVVREGTSWKDVLDALREADLEFVENQLPNYPYKDVLRALKVSIDILEQEDAAYARHYLELAIFPGDIAVPEATVIKLWTSINGLSERSARRLLTRLGSCAMLRLDGEPPNRRVTLHDLQHDYLRAEQHDHLPELHRQLLDAYDVKRWAYMPRDEPYLWDTLAYHLVGAGRSAELVATIKDLSYLMAKIDVRNGFALDGDLTAALAQAPDDIPLLLLRPPLGNMVYILNRCQTQAEIAGTLYTRLQHLPELTGICHAFELQIPRPYIGIWHTLPDLPHPNLIRTLDGHTEHVAACVISPDGTWIVSASWDRTLKIWDPVTGQIRRTLEGHKDAVLCCAISPDGTWIVSGSHDKTLKVWDASTGAELRTLTGHTSWINDCAVSPDGTWIASASNDQTLRIWDTETWQLKLTINDKDSLTFCTISPDGRRIITVPYGFKLKVWDASTGAQQLALAGHRYTLSSGAISSDGKWIASASRDKTVKIWDALSGVERMTLGEHGGEIRACAFSPDGRWIVSAAGEDLTLWNVTTGHAVLTLEGHEYYVSDCAFSPDGTWIVSASFDGPLKIWDVSVTKELLPPKRDVIRHGAYLISPDGRWRVSALIEGMLKIEDATKPLDKRPSLKDDPFELSSYLTAPDGSWAVLALDNGTLRVWDIMTGRTRFYLKGHQDEVHQCAISPDGTWLVSTSDDSSLIIWDASTGGARLSLKGHRDGVWGCAISPDGTWLASASSDQTVKIWDAASGIVKRTLIGHTDQVFSCAISPDGTWLVSASWDNTLKVWNPVTGDCLATFHAGARLRECAIFPDGDHIIATGNAGVYWLRLVR